MIEIKAIDLNNIQHTKALLQLLSAYALDPLGGGDDISDEVKANLIPALQQQNNYYGFITWHHEQPIALANCFTGFSSFYAKPLLNIHDFAVMADYRGQGLGKALMAHVCDFAKKHGFCKVTLEVLSSNEPAKAVYRKAGFAQYVLADDVAEFWQTSVLN